jgi:hypothetical protein
VFQHDDAHRITSDSIQIDGYRAEAASVPDREWKISIIGFCASRLCGSIRFRNFTCSTMRKHAKCETREKHCGSPPGEGAACLTRHDAGQGAVRRPAGCLAAGRSDRGLAVAPAPPFFPWPHWCKLWAGAAVLPALLYLRSSAPQPWWGLALQHTGVAAGVRVRRPGHAGLAWCGTAAAACRATPQEAGEHTGG